MVLEFRFADHLAEPCLVGDELFFVEMDFSDQAARELKEDSDDGEQKGEVDRCEGGGELEDGAAPEGGEEAGEEIEEEREADDRSGRGEEEAPTLDGGGFERLRMESRKGGDEVEKGGGRIGEEIDVLR